MADTVSFVKEFTKRVSRLPNIEKVEFFGSVLESNRYKPGRSNIDVLVHGKPNEDTKHEIREIALELNKKYDLKFEKAPYLHPIPFYIKRNSDMAILNNIFKPPFSYFLVAWRKGKKESPKVTVEERWKGKKDPSLFVILGEAIWG